jgi:PAS domain S-box-containing protein
MRLSLGAKVRLGFLSAVGLVAVIGVMALISLGRVNHEVQDVLRKDILFARAGEAIKIYFLETRRAEKNYLVFGQERDIKGYEFFVAKLREALQQGKELTRRDETRDKYRAVEQLLQQYEQMFARLLTVPPEAREEVRRVSQELSEVGQQIVAFADEIAEAKWAELTMHAVDADRIESVAKRHMGVILGLTVVSGLLLALYLSHTIVGPTRQLVDLSKRTQDAGLHIDVDAPNSDEIGELHHLISAMLTRIRLSDDLQARKISEERRRVEVLCNLLREGVLLIDNGGRVSWVNPTALDFFGLSQSDMEGRPLKEIPLEEPIRQALLRSVDARERFHDTGITLMPADRGGRLRRISLSTAFVRAENGEIMDIVCVFHEITGDSGERSAGDEVVKGVVQELAERLRVAFEGRDGSGDSDDRQEGRAGR